MEEWKVYPKWNGMYEVSNLGQVRNTKTKRLRKPVLNTQTGYFYVNARPGGKFSRSVNLKVSRVVAECFLPNPDNMPQVNHINGVKTDNRVENLEWCTQSHNMFHAHRTGLCTMKKGTENPKSKLTEECKLELVSGLQSNRAIARKYGVAHTTAQKWLKQIQR